MAHAAPSPGRDLRIDLFRGAALLMIFINHLPWSPLSLFTVRNWGWSDSAEVFVLLAGLAAALAYGRIFERDGFRAGILAVFRRIRTLYLTHLALFLIVGYLCLLAAQTLSDATYFEMLGFSAVFEAPLRYAPDVLFLMFQPGLLDILPLYTILLAFVPLLVLLHRLHRFAPLLVSLAVYAAVMAYPVNLPNTLRDGSFWFFNPLAWQALFAVGFTLGQALRAPPAGTLPCGLRHAITALAAFYTAVAVLVVGPWREIPGWENSWLVDPNLLAVASKTMLHPLRFLDILAKLWLVAVLVPASAGWLASPAARPLVVMGRHALPVFAASIVLSVAGGILIEALPSATMTLLVTAGGMGTMVMIGLAGEARRAGIAPVSKPAPPVAEGASLPATS